MPGSGAGGGWRGDATSGTGTTSITDKNFHKAFVASGSSYISGEYCCSLHPEVSFYKRQMISGDHEGDALIKINTIFNCSSNCYSCSSKDVCTKCNGNYIMYNNGNVLSCPDGYIEINCKCEPCKSPCGQCIESTTKCTTCKSPCGHLAMELWSSDENPTDFTLRFALNGEDIELEKMENQTQVKYEDFKNAYSDYQKYCAEVPI